MQKHGLPPLCSGCNVDQVGGGWMVSLPPSHMASITYLEVPFGRNGFIGCRMDMYLQSRRVIRGSFIKDVCLQNDRDFDHLPLYTHATY